MSGLAALAPASYPARKIVTVGISWPPTALMTCLPPCSSTTFAAM